MHGEGGPAHIVQSCFDAPFFLWRVAAEVKQTCVQARQRRVKPRPSPRLLHDRVRFRRHALRVGVERRDVELCHKSQCPAEPGLLVGAETKSQIITSLPFPQNGAKIWIWDVACSRANHVSNAVKEVEV